jgi:hypothetical protein
MESNIGASAVRRVLGSGLVKRDGEFGCCALNLVTDFSLAGIETQDMRQ